jgi:hypothetical protein
LLCCDTTTARNISSTCTTGARQTIVVENSTTYGGAGYTYEDVATTSINSSAPLVAVHELGHSLFNLGDEYNYGYSDNSYPNCDSGGCAKWQDMIGYNGVNCMAGYCASSGYSVSEYTIMQALSYQFEEVNERVSCCAYGLAAGTYPPYCDQFKQFTTTGNLSQFCQNPSSISGAAPVPGEYIADPEVVTFSRDPASGEWQIESVAQGRPGFYPTRKVRGEGAGPIRVDVGFANGATHQLRFSDQADVEFPGQGDRLGGMTPMPRNTLTVVVDRKGRGAVVSMNAHDEGVH